MQRISVTAAGALVALLAAVVAGAAGPVSEPQAGPPSLLLTQVRVFEVAEGVFGPPRDLLVKGGRIAEPGERIEPGEALETIDCAGKFALPGLFDCHTHLAHLTRLAEDSLRSALEAFVRRGVLQVRDVGGPIDVMSGLHRRIAAGELPGPEVFYTGPMLESSPLTWEAFNEDLPGFTVAIDTPADVDSLLPELARQGARLIKTFNKIDRDLYRHLVAVAERCSLRIVHDPGLPLFHWMPMDEAIALGVTSIEHAKSPWPVVLEDSLRHRQDAASGPGANPMAQMAVMMQAVEQGPGAISAARLQALADSMVARGAFLCPTLHVFIAMGAMDEEDARMPDGEPIAEPQRAMMKKVMAAMESVSRHCVAEFARRGVRMLVGQDGVSGAATLAEMRHMRDCGVGEAEILRGATIYPAEWLGVADRLGSLDPGKLANILVLDADPLAEIAHMEETFLVVQQGRIVGR